MNHNLLYSHNCYFCYQNRLEMTHLYNVGLEHRQKLPGRNSSVYFHLALHLVAIVELRDALFQILHPKK